MAAKKIYIDIMQKGRFIRQMTYTYLPIFPIDPDDVIAKVKQTFPSLANQQFTIAFSNQRAIR